MADFGFISDDRLRNIIERDKQELDACLAQKLCKSTLLLAGSIIEAVLVDYFLAFPQPGFSANKVLEASLSDLIDQAERVKLISPRTKELSIVSRSYRNLIHPGKEHRLGERVDIHTTTVAASLVEIVVEEIAENYAKQRGYTADQAISKVQRRDPASISIFGHVVDGMVLIERIRLFKNIPIICSRSEDVSTVTRSFLHLHDVLKSKVPDETLRSEARMLHEYMLSRSRPEFLFYFRFFRDQLDLLDPDERAAIVRYILDVPTTSTKEELRLYCEWGIFGSIGPYIAPANVRDVTMRLAIGSGDTGVQDDEASLEVLLNLLRAMKYDQARLAIAEIRSLTWLGNRVSSWANYLDQNLDEL